MRFLETSRKLTVRPRRSIGTHVARRPRSTFLPADAMSETEKLIDLVRERPFLYDMNDPEYKNRPKRLATWKEIASEMGSGNADMWSAKWKGLKDNFAKFKKSTEPLYSESYKKYKNWPWSEHVRFLDECNFTSSRRIRCTPRRATNSIADVNTEESNDAEQELTEIRRKRKRHNSEPSEEDQEINHKNKKNNNSSPDGVDQFFLSYAQSFKKLPSRMQIMLKLEIATLFTRYELQANGVTPESVDNIPRIVPHPVKLEFDFFNTIDD